MIKISETILDRDLDYVSADQLCSIFREHRDVNIVSRLTAKKQLKLNISSYGNYLLKCAGVASNKPSFGRAYQCLVNKENHDWGCLTSYPKELDVEACTLAKSRNSDPENADDMMWFCYANMRDNNYLSRPVCLELTHHFSLLGNQIKMNWNCMNRVSKF